MPKSLQSIKGNQSVYPKHNANDARGSVGPVGKPPKAGMVRAFASQKGGKKGKSGY